jgi:hypothetical protein
MSELVANLRSYATKYANDYGYCVASDLNKAATRIEVMEAALQEIANDPEYYGQRAQMFKKIALKALTEQGR